MCARIKLKFSFLQKKIAFWCSFKCAPNWCLVCLLEHEKDRHLPFLDSNFSRRFQGNLETSVYCKPTPWANTTLSILTTLFSIKSLWPKLFSGGLTVYHLHLIWRLRRGNMFLMSYKQMAIQNLSLLRVHLSCHE